MFGERSDGSIVELEKDCDCRGHDGPHWLFENAVALDAAVVLLTSGNVAGFANAEHARCARHQQELSARGLRRTFTGTELKHAVELNLLTGV